MALKKTDYKVLFVCTGNMCRSPMAEGILRKMIADQGLTGIKVSSAGTSADDGNPASGPAVEVAWEDGVDLSRHRSRYLTKVIADQADLVLAMAGSHYSQVLDLDPEYLYKTYLVREFGRSRDLPANKDIFDPMGGDYGTYQACYEAIKAEMARIFPLIKKLAGKKGE